MFQSGSVGFCTVLIICGFFFVILVTVFSFFCYEGEGEEKGIGEAIKVDEGRRVWGVGVVLMIRVEVVVVFAKVVMVGVADGEKKGRRRGKKNVIFVKK